MTVSNDVPCERRSIQLALACKLHSLMRALFTPVPSAIYTRATSCRAINVFLCSDFCFSQGRHNVVIVVVVVVVKATSIRAKTFAIKHVCKVSNVSRQVLQKQNTRLYRTQA